ncbi:MAG TPA: glyoxalase superfamily protein [Fimbriimonas sp.]|nr:glyoxalase superfamily protein [Fimbriimonas sp.]
MARIENISILSIPVSDQQRAKEFYVDMLGFHVWAEEPMGERGTWLQLGLEGAQTSITLVTWFEWLKPGSVGGNVLKCSGIEDVHASLRKKGLEISDIDDQPWGRFANFKDPDGNGWILMGESL